MTDDTRYARVITAAEYQQGKPLTDAMLDEIEQRLRLGYCSPGTELPRILVNEIRKLRGINERMATAVWEVIEALFHREHTTNANRLTSREIRALKDALVHALPDADTQTEPHP